MVSLPYSLMTVKAIQLGKAYFSAMQNLENFFNILPADDKYFLVNRDKLTQPLQILLS